MDRFLQSQHNANYTNDVLITIVEHMAKPQKDIIIRVKNHLTSPVNIILELSCLYYETFDDVAFDVVSLPEHTTYKFEFIRPFDKSFYLFQALLLNYKKLNKESVSITYFADFGDGVVR